MKVTSLKAAETKVRPDGVAMTEFFAAADGAKVTMGHAVFPAGTVVPWAAHDADEYAFILSGNFCKVTRQSSSGSSYLSPASVMAWCTI